MAAYELVVAAKDLRPGVPAKLVDVHRVLTLLPGAARDYTRQEFARDLYLLDQSGIVNTKDGRRMTLPASAMTRRQRCPDYRDPGWADQNLRGVGVHGVAYVIPVDEYVSFLEDEYLSGYVGGGGARSSLSCRPTTRPRRVPRRVHR